MLFVPKLGKKVARNAEFANMCFASPSGQGVFQVQIKDYQHIVISMLHVIVEGGLLSCYLMLEK